MAAQPGGMAVGRKIGVDGYLNKQGTGDVGRGLEEDGECGDCGLELVRAEIAEQAAH